MIVVPNHGKRNIPTLPSPVLIYQLLQKKSCMMSSHRSVPSTLISGLSISCSIPFCPFFCVSSLFFRFGVLSFIFGKLYFKKQKNARWTWMIPRYLVKFWICFEFIVFVCIFCIFCSLVIVFYFTFHSLLVASPSLFYKCNFSFDQFGKYLCVAVVLFHPKVCCSSHAPPNHLTAFSLTHYTHTNKILLVNWFSIFNAPCN